jgi:hypothetical protein
MNAETQFSFEEICLAKTFFRPLEIKDEPGIDHSPQSSSAWGASATPGGSTLVTSSSVPHSGHEISSPLIVPSANSTSPEHTGHSIDVAMIFSLVLKKIPQ